MLLTLVLLLSIPQILTQYGGDIRLVGGSYQWEGRVEIYLSGIWGTITDPDWTNEDAVVVCRKLGYITQGAKAKSNAYYGEGNGTIHLDFVQCSGKEHSLTDCEISQNSTNHHSLDVGVKCKPVCVNGEIRLVGGETEREGTLEICYSRRWKTVCNINWKNQSTAAVCEQLGFSAKDSTFYSSEGSENSSGLNIFNCIGEDKESWESCFNMYDQCMYTDDIRIHCIPVFCIDGDVRLVGGAEDWEGRLEMCFNGRWGTIGSNGWSENNTKVVCDTLGFEISDHETALPIPQSLSKPVFRSNVTCHAGVLTILDCGYDINTTDIDVIIRCKLSSCSDWDIKLVGENYHEGRLEICFDQRWTAIVGDGWGIDDTMVACKQLGHTLTDDISFEIVEGSLSIPVKLDHIGCHGGEERLEQCNYVEYETLLFNYNTHNEAMLKIVTINCPKMEHTESPSDDNTSGNQSAIVAAIAIAVLCFSMVIGSIIGYIILTLIRRKKERPTGNTIVVDDNVSYMTPSTKCNTSTHTVEDPYYSSVSITRKEAGFTSSCQQPIPLTTTMGDTQEAGFTSSCQQPLPPIPLTTIMGGNDMIPIHHTGNQGSENKCDPIYDSCK